jgi:catechol 2,3-dioxygenase-like lactoylglutathione lyase family enzyme
MLSSERLVAFVSTTNADHARAFFRDKLGLHLVSEDNFALVFDSNGAPLRVSIAKEVKPAPYTVLGWNVTDIHATILELNKAGITCEIFGFFKQDELGIWIAPGGTRVAWFKDPDGNILSVSQHA